MILNKQSLIKKLLFAGVSTLAIIVIIDVIAYHLIDIKVPGHKPRRFFQHSPDFGWFHRPDSEGYWYRDHTRHFVRINTHGFADSERDLYKTRPRIALIGDSTTEFWEADVDCRGQYVMEEMLGSKYEVLNFGVRGFGTDQTYLVFNNIGIHFSPDTVVYTLCINDFWNNVDTVGKPYFDFDDGKPGKLVLSGCPVDFQSFKYMGGDFDLSEHSLTFRAFRHLMQSSKAKIDRLFGGAYSDPQPHARLDVHFELRPYKKQYDSEDQRRVEITLKLISLLDDLIANQGMRFLLVEGVYKPVMGDARRQQLENIYGDVFDYRKVTRILQAFAHENEIAFLSLQEMLEDGEPEISGLVYSRDNMHFNNEGARFFAESVVEKLRRLQWVD